MLIVIFEFWFEVLKVMFQSFQFMWDIMLCHWVSCSCCCEGTHSLWNVKNCSLSDAALHPRWHNSSLWSWL